MPVLDPQHGKLLYVGTVWQKDNLAHQIMQDPTYDYKKKYQAVIQWPDRMDLWEQYKALMLSDPDKGKELADEFYEGCKDEMNRGAIVLWSTRWPFKRLFDEKISVGSRSFSLSY